MPTACDRAMLNTYGYIDRRNQSSLNPEDRLSPLLWSGQGGDSPPWTNGTPRPSEAAAQPTDCPEHAHCAYQGSETERCPWCHSTWSHIIATDWHSCEQAWVWNDGKRGDNKAHKAWRVETAALMRREAALQPWQRRSVASRYQEYPGAFVDPAQPENGGKAA